jgi:hypothetical protein
MALGRRDHAKSGRVETLFRRQLLCRGLPQCPVEMAMKFSFAPCTIFTAANVGRPAVFARFAGEIEPYVSE